jgi:hypothetical protein
MKTSGKIVLTILILFSGITGIFAQDSKEKIKTQTDEYFSGEKKSSLSLMGIGGFSILYGLSTMNGEKTTWTSQYNVNQTLYQQGFATTMVGFGILEAFVGSTIYFGTDAQVGNLKKQIDSDPKSHRNEELNRMDKVNAKFRNYRVTEVLIISGGLLGTYYAQMKGDHGSGLDKLIGHEKQESYLKGFSHGLILHGAILLALDFFADNRATIYTEALRNLQVSYVPPTQNQNREAFTSISTTFRF